MRHKFHLSSYTGYNLIEKMNKYTPFHLICAFLTGEDHSVGFSANNKVNFFKFCLCLIFLSACHTGKHKEINHSHLIQIILKKNQMVSIDSLNSAIGSASEIAVDHLGKIYIEDRKEAKIRVLSPNGHYLFSLGKRGRGPGEFESLYHIYIYGDTLYAIESYPGRLTKFRIDNRQLIQTLNFPNIKVDKNPIGIPTVIYPLQDKNYEMIYRNTTRVPKPKITFSINNHNLTPLDTDIRRFSADELLVYRGPHGNILGYFRKGLLPKTIAKFGPKGHLYEARSDSLNIRVFDRSGEKIQDITSNYSPPILNNHDLDSLAKEMKPHVKTIFYKAISQNKNKLSGRWQALQNFLVDNRGRCWVQFLDPGKLKQTWWVFNKEGHPKWKFKLSRHVKLYVIRKSEAYGIWSKKGEYPRIIRYHITGMQE